jgi:hypothetical protein
VSVRRLTALAVVGSVFMSVAALAQTRASDYAAIVQQICRGYAAAQHALPYGTMYAQCMYAPGLFGLRLFAFARFAGLPG